ncbi:MAG: hypothetical protein Q4D17_08245 [Planctomycetia bacterium]|nr:hypothetical protein [Planctomycetia bacterium]
MRSQFTNKKHSRHCRGVLTLEWLLLFVLLTIGIVGGIAAMRDSISLKFISASEALGALDTSYEVPDYESENKEISVPTQIHVHKKITLTPTSGSNSQSGT